MELEPTNPSHHRQLAYAQLLNDASEVRQGFECGIGIAGYQDVKVGDVIEAFVVEETAASLT